MGWDMPLGSGHSSAATDSGSIPMLPVSLDHSTQQSSGQGIILSSFETDIFLFFGGGGYVPSFRIIETESNQVDIGAVAENLAGKGLLLTAFRWNSAALGPCGPGKSQVSRGFIESACRTLSYLIFG